MSYLYGAAVQGIQSFIFRTNDLKDIIGASELVERICTDLFEETVGEYFRKEELIIGAAGNVRYLTENRETCERAVRDFPRRVMTAAPGITISQAVVEMEEGMDFTDAVNQLEEKLKSQRNRPQPDLTLGVLGMRRYGKTGLPIAEEGMDLMTKAKREAINDQFALAQKCFYGRDASDRVSADRYPFDVSKLTRDNDWIAVIHADGNSLGQVVQKVGKDRERYCMFSRELDKATVRAANKGFQKLGIEPDKDYYPLRPVVLGGDDLTVIIRGDLAISYAESFIRSFEEETREGELGTIVERNIGQKGLTACAGIAFIKSSYPFHYGYKLAEELCSAAKKDAKAHKQGERIPTCLMFHKVEDSFVDSYAEIVRRVLMPQEDISFSFGPYYMEPLEGRFTIEDLTNCCKSLKNTEEDGVRSGLRRWLSILHTNPEQAAQHLDRMKKVYSNEKSVELVEELTNERVMNDDAGKEVKYYPAYDVLSLYSVHNVTTKD